ncbi:MAG TPA: HAD-IA family hydrolase [Methylomirabilota bacterium]|nr:HAD-IA family hydrolase [Methylomirabilota bacterium]
MPRRLPGTELFAPARISTESAASADRYVSLMLEELGVADVEVARAIAAWRRAYNLPVGVWGRADPDAGAALALARTAGLRAAVISNSNGAIRAILDGLGLTRHLDFVLDSSEVGVEKPDPRIFRSALERAGVRPEEAVYVGDLYSVDVLGAGTAGQSDRHDRDRGGLRAAGRPSMWVGVCGTPEPVAPAPTRS